MSALAELGGLSSKLRPLPVIPTGPLQYTLQRFPAAFADDENDDERRSEFGCQIVACASRSPVAPDGRLWTCRSTARPWPVSRQICMPVVMVPMMELGWVFTQFWHLAAVGIPGP